MLTHERLIEVVNYDPNTGVFTWLIDRSHNALAGGVAGNVTGKRILYKRVIIDDTQYLAHRLAWFYVHRVMPAKYIDHINGDTFDNRIRNLREADDTINMQNRHKASKHNKTQTLGVSEGPDGRFNARIGHNYKNIHLGRFSTKEEAHEAYKKAKRKLHIGCAI